MPGKSLPAIYLQQALVIACAAVAVALAANALSDAPSLLPGEGQQTAAPASEGSPALVSVDEAGELLGKALFIDARDELDYRDGHLPGAANVLPGSLSEAPLPVVVYCSDPECGKAMTVARRLAESGARIMVMEEGIIGWAAAGGPLEVSP